MTGTRAAVRIPMADGVELAATLYLPDPRPGPQPCLLEALPYRKDDLTSSYAAGYRGLRDDARVRRVPARPARHRVVGRRRHRRVPARRADATCATVIAWLAEQEWCDGNVGMFGTSYSGFNSLQIACERPPALKAICAIYASDDRWTDDVHWRGGALRLVDLVDYCHYMTPMCVLPPVPAVWGGDWRDEWRRRLETNEPWVLTWLRENRDGAYWRAGSVRLGGTARGYERIECPTMIVAGWADGYRNNSFRTVAALGAARRPAPAARRPVGARRPGDRDARARGSTSTSRWPRGSTAGCAAPAPTSATDRAATSSSAPRPVPEPDLDLHEGYWVAAAVAADRRRVATSTLDGPRSLRGRARRRHGRLDRLRRPPALGAVRRPARRRRPLADLGLGPAAAAGRRPAAGAAPGQRRPRRPPRCR